MLADDSNQTDVFVRAYYLRLREANNIFIYGK